jgi:hypothetical protein
VVARRIPPHRLAQPVSLPAPRVFLKVVVPYLLTSFGFFNFFGPFEFSLCFLKEVKEVKEVKGV